MRPVQTRSKSSSLRKGLSIVMADEPTAVACAAHSRMASGVAPRARGRRHRPRGLAVGPAGRRRRAEVPASSVLGRLRARSGRAQRSPERWFTFKEAVGGWAIGCASAFLVALGACALAPARPRLHALRDRRERGPDHRFRTDHQRLVRNVLSTLQDGDRRGPVLLPGARQLAPWADLGSTGVDRADALVCGQ